MSKWLQWVIGIGVVLLVAAVIFSAVAPLLGIHLGLMGGFVGGPERGHMFGGGQFDGRPGMGRMPFGFFGLPLFGLGLIARPLLWLGLIVLVVYLFTRGRSAAPVAVAPAAAAPAQPEPPAPTVPCANCGRPLQTDWVACPYCGEKRSA